MSPPKGAIQGVNQGSRFNGPLRPKAFGSMASETGSGDDGHSGSTEPLPIVFRYLPRDTSDWDRIRVPCTYRRTIAVKMLVRDNDVYLVDLQIDWMEDAHRLVSPHERQHETCPVGIVLPSRSELSQ